MAYNRRFSRYAKRNSYGYRKASSLYRRTKGNYRAGSQQRDSTQVVLNGIYNLTLTGASSDTAIGSYAAGAVSIWQLLQSSNFYDNYKAMYDQIKIDGTQIKILGNSANTYVPASGLSSISTAFAWDRNGISPDDFDYTVSSEAIENGITMAPQDDTKAGYVLSYGSCKTKNWATGNAFTQWMSLYPSTIQEKSVYLDTAATTAMYVEDGDAIGFPSGRSTADLTAVQYNPVLTALCYNIPTAATSTTPSTFTFTLEYKINVTLRGLRKM